MVGRTAAELPLWADAEAAEGLVARFRREGRLTDEDALLHVRGGPPLACAVSAAAVDLAGRPCLLLVAPRAPERARAKAEVAAAVAAVLTDAGTITAAVLDRLSHPVPGEGPAEATPGLSALPARAREVLDLVSRGLDDAAIAGRLGLSRTTVRNHVNGLYRRLGVGSRAQLVVWARQRGIGADRA